MILAIIDFVFKIAVWIWVIYAAATLGDKLRSWGERVEKNTQACVQMVNQ